MTDATPLSPAAQAVLDATSGTFGNYQFSARRQMLAAALRAAADQVVPADQPCSLDELKVQCRIRAIAMHLERLDD